MISTASADDSSDMTAPTDTGLVRLSPADTSAPLGLERQRLLQGVYRRVFGDAGPVRIGRYTVLERIGAGAMGVVFKAYDNELDRLTAIKVLPRALTGDVGRHDLAREAKALAKLSHPNVVGVYEVGQSDEGEMFLAMEFVHGTNLREWLASRPRSPSEIVEVVLQAAAGIIGAHGVGLIHRDIKPENILVGEDGRARVADFGLARIQEHEAGAAPSHTRAQTEHRVGTPAYMAPELLMGAPATPASDQFAFCVTVFEALFGYRPFSGEEPAELLGAIETGATVDSRSSKVPSALARVVLRGLAANPQDRHPSMQTFASALRRSSRSRRTWQWTAAAATLVAVGGAAGWAIAGSAFDAPRAADPTAEVVAQAAVRLANDPGAAVATLASLSPSDDPALRNRVRAIAEQAEASGVPESIVSIPPQLRATVCDDGAVWLLSHDGKLYRMQQESDGPVKHPLGTAPAKFREHLFGISCHDVSPDGTLFVSGGVDDRLLVEPETGRSHPLGRARWDAKFSADGAVVAYAADEALWVFDRRTWTAAMVRQLPTATEKGTFALDPTGTYVAVLADDVVEVHDWAQGKVQVLDNLTANAVDFVPGRSELVIVAEAGGLHRWDWSTGERTFVGPSATSRMVGVEVSADGRWIITDDVKTIELRSMDGTRSRSWPADGYDISADGRRIVMRDESSLRIVDVESWNERTFPLVAAPLSFALGADSRTLTAHVLDRVMRWQLPEARPGLRGHTHHVVALAFSHDEQSLFSSGRDFTLRRWDVATGESVVLADRIEGASELLVAPDDRWLAVSNSEGVHVVDARDGQDIAHGPAGQTTMAPDGSLLTVVNDAIERWDPVSGERERLGSGIAAVVGEGARCMALAVSPDGTRIVGNFLGDSSRPTSGLEASNTVVWSFPELEHVTTLPHPSFGPIAFWPDRSHLFASMTFGTNVVWDIDTGEKHEAPTGSGFMSSLALASAEPDLLLTSSRDGLFLRFGSEEAVANLPMPESHQLALSPSGRWFAYTTDADQIAIRERPLASVDVYEWLQTHVPRKFDLELDPTPRQALDLPSD